MTSHVSGIVLAAGFSTRMGRPKLVCRLDGESIIFRVVDSALRSSLRNVIVVTGRAEELIVDTLQELVSHSRLTIIQNQNPEAGMASSITTGMSALPHEAQGVMIILGDQGKLSASVVDRLLAEFDNHPTSIVVPTIYGGDTTPVVFPAAFHPDLKRLSGDFGGRSIIQRAQDAVVRIELGGVYDDRDVDTEDDLRRLQEA
jgi:molybdenum cofactor cytidylyltransferase